MSDNENDEPSGGSRSVLGTAFRGSVKVVSTARDALQSNPVKAIRGGIKSVVGGFATLSRFMRSNTLRGLLTGELIVSQSSLNRWFSRVEPPDGVSDMRLICRPSRLVLTMKFERRLLGVRVAKAKVELPFEIVSVDISTSEGVVELRLDRDATSAARGFLPSILLRLMSRAATDLLDERSQLDTIDNFSEIIRREGDLLVVDVGKHPAFVELMNRELRLIGGRSLFPFRAIQVYDAHVQEGRLVISTRLTADGVADQRRLEELLDAQDALEVEIV